MNDPETLLSVKELAEALGRNRTYIFAMKRCGFLMPGNRSSVRLAMSFLSRNPLPRSERNNTEQLEC